MERSLPWGGLEPPPMKLFAPLLCSATLLLPSCHDADNSSAEEPGSGAAVDAARQALWSLPPPSWPPPPQDTTCVVLQRGALGQVEDTDISPGNGDWIAGDYAFQWTGPSPADHWAVYRFDLSPIPAGAQVVSATFAVNVQYNADSSVVRAHRVVSAWSEATAKWSTFGGLAGWDPTIEGTFDPSGLGYKLVTLTPLVQAWVAGAQPNHGLLLEEDPVFLHAYTSSEASEPNQRPALRVCYSSAAGPCAGKANGDACDDGEACTAGETCMNGQCQGGSLLTCPAPDDCHDDGVCDPQTGACVPPVRPNGSPCDDGDACTGPDVCAAGACGGAPVSCDDGSACTTDACDAIQGCSHAAVSCDDSDACTADACDPGAGCTHQAVTCNDGDACTTDACDPQVGCVTTPVACDDGVACTADTCAPGAGCNHVIACPPGQPCAQGFCASPQAQDPQWAWICNP